MKILTELIGIQSKRKRRGLKRQHWVERCWSCSERLPDQRQGVPCTLNKERAPTQLRDRSTKIRLATDSGMHCQLQGGVKGVTFMPEKTKTENTPATSSDELAELLLYVWLRSEVKDDFDLPLAIAN